MESPSLTINVLEHCGVYPSADANAVTSLPLKFFDLVWLTFHPLGRVIFYDFQYSTDHFTQNIVPKIKTSLSLALKHFTPLAGNLILPSNTDSNMDISIHYLDGDSVSVTFAECISRIINPTECTDNFDHFSGNHARLADVLNPLVPQLPSATCTEISGEDCSVASLIAIQVTVFPDRAICIGITNSHVVADGSTMFNFVQAWASIAKQINISDNELDTDNLASSGCFQIPFYDRSSVPDPYGLGDLYKKSRVASATRQHEKLVKQKEDAAQDSSNIKVRATFVLTESKIQALKNAVLTKLPTLTHLSSFTVVCAYLWTCFAKTRATVWESEHDLDEPQNFSFAMDARARLDPPLPAAYFGNCLVGCLGVQTGRVMIGDEGLVAAAEVFGNAISAKVKNGALHGSDKWMEEFAGIIRGEWNIGIAGSPKMDYYNNIDFGWGKALKFEFAQEPLSLSRCRNSKTDIEIGVILPKIEMDVFSTVLSQGLDTLHG
ncbi:malonyl-coenzyme A:anthocyanin 3-O-glucoside-6''-O-malonyltransferase-like [Apium graveolens]|uniref:malonyl-coenzyme A:anthocyanin 3-O-glucoside-6''-O-malonyltransferase-like n=1 Tax=Apium graveolens TaxID=4045 RepID=UPI003D7BAE83